MKKTSKHTNVLVENANRFMNESDVELSEDRQFNPRQISKMIQDKLYIPEKGSVTSIEDEIRYEFENTFGMDLNQSDKLMRAIYRNIESAVSDHMSSTQLGDGTEDEQRNEETR